MSTLAGVGLVSGTAGRRSVWRRRQERWALCAGSTPRGRVETRGCATRWKSRRARRRGARRCSRHGGAARARRRLKEQVAAQRRKVDAQLRNVGDAQVLSVTRHIPRIGHRDREQVRRLAPARDGARTSSPAAGKARRTGARAANPSDHDDVCAALARGRDGSRSALKEVIWPHLIRSIEGDEARDHPAEDARPPRSVQIFQQAAYPRRKTPRSCTDCGRRSDGTQRIILGLRGPEHLDLPRARARPAARPAVGSAGIRAPAPRRDQLLRGARRRPA